MEEPEEAAYDGRYQQFGGELSSDSSEDESVAASRCEERPDEARQRLSGAESKDIAEVRGGVVNPESGPDLAELELWHSNEHSPAPWDHEPLAESPVPKETSASVEKAPGHAEG